jgi:hypothetical protein
MLVLLSGLCHHGRWDHRGTIRGRINTFREDGVRRFDMRMLCLLGAATAYQVTLTLEAPTLHWPMLDSRADFWWVNSIQLPGSFLVFCSLAVRTGLGATTVASTLVHYGAFWDDLRRCLLSRKQS